MNNYFKAPVRDAAILTTSYVAAPLLGSYPDIQSQNQLLLYVDFTKGSLTSAEIKIEFADSVKYTLAYDAQVANFTVGALVQNLAKTASGIIVADSDSGASGTLTLANVVGTFTDNEVIKDQNGGEATVNGVLTDASNWYQETASSVSGGTITETLAEHTITATGKYRLAVPLKDRYVRVSAKGTGTVTDSSLAITAILGEV